ncbi:MAG: ATP-binding cassette domain-containing protein [Chloroflexi bacterium]|nr:ATP-binding cassette domain-containing protein [Chloroflexota bacterium]
MESAFETGLAAPEVKARLRRRLTPPLQRARSILLGVFAIVLLIVAILVVVIVFLRIKGAVDTLTSLWPAYVVAGLGYLATRGYRDRRLWALGLSVAIGTGLAGLGIALIAAVFSVEDADGNRAFGIGFFGLVLALIGLNISWALARGWSWFTELRNVEGPAIATVEVLEKEHEIADLTIKAGAAPVVPIIEAIRRDDIEPLVSVRGLKKHFPIVGGLLRHQIGTIYAVDGVDFDIYPGEVFSLVGESGCGKTTLGRTLLQLTPPTDGKVIFNGFELEDVDPEDMRPLRRRMQIIFQDPFGSLNPRMPVSDIIGEGLYAQGITNRAERDKRVEDSLEIVGLRRDYTRRFPHEFSGGQRQRIGIARALALNPDFVVCDEPVSALDVSIQSQVLNLLLDLKRDLNLTYLFISHNLSVVEYFSDRIGVMYLGKIAELGTVEELYRNPRHPYTVALLSAIPDPDPRRRRKRLVLKGDVPSPAAPPPGCRFHTRCWLRERLGNPEQCVTTEPLLRVLDDTGHQAACHFAEEINETVVQETAATQSAVETAVAE